MNLMLVVGLCGQWIGIGLIMGGIVYEKKYKAHWGFVAISAGSLIFALGTKILGF